MLLNFLHLLKIQYDSTVDLIDIEIIPQHDYLKMQDAELYIHHLSFRLQSMVELVLKEGPSWHCKKKYMENQYDIMISHEHCYCFEFH